MPSGDYEWLKCPWIPRDFPKDNLAENVPLQHTKSRFSSVKKVNVPWNMHRSRITHKYFEVSCGLLFRVVVKDPFAK